MAVIQGPSEIEARLQAFIDSTPSQLPACTDSDEPLVIFYTRRDSDVPYLESHPLIFSLTTGHPQVSFQEAEILPGETPENRVLFQLDIRDSSLRNCTLISCNVHGGRFEACYFTDCHFAEKKLCILERGNASDSSAAQSISDSRIENGSICDTEVINSSLKSVNRLQDCELKNSLLVDSVARESRLTNCDVHDSKLHNCTVLDGVLTDSVISTKYTTALRALPAEIREMVYADVFEDAQAALELVGAFRPDPLLYNEILEMCFRKHTFVLSGESLEALKSTPDAVKRRFTKINLKGPKMIPTNNPAAHFPTGTRITDITMEFFGGQNRNVNIQPFYDVCRLVRKLARPFCFLVVRTIHEFKCPILNLSDVSRFSNWWFKYFITVKTFTVIWVDDGTYNPQHYSYNYPLEGPIALRGAIRTANQWMKRPAVRVQGMRDTKATLTWIWTAEEDEVLAWLSLLLDHQGGCSDCGINH